MGFGDWLSQQGFRVTGGRRDPNSRLGRANPNSWHNQADLYDKGFGAFDVRPRKGMTFEQFRDRVSQDGWNVREAIDEVNHPSKHATGPHWHMAVDGRKEQQPMAGTGLAALMQNNPALMSPQQFLQQPTQEPSLASYLQAPLTNEVMQKPTMPDPSAGFVEMAPLPGVKPSTWGQGGKGWQIMGIIGDALQTMGGGQATYMPYVQEQQRLETEGRQRLAERQAERQATLQDWIYRQQYEAANKPNDLRVATQNWQALSPEEKAAYAAMMDIKSPIAVSGPQGTFRVPRGFGQPSNGPATQTIDGQTYYQINGKWYDNPEGR